MGDDPRPRGPETPGVLTSPADASPEAGPTDAGRSDASRGNGGRILRVGILCDGPRLRAWQAWCIEELLEVEGVEPVVVVPGERHRGGDAVAPGADPRAGEAGDGFPGFRSPGRALWGWYRRRFLDGVSEALAEVDVAERWPAVPVVAHDSAAVSRMREVELHFVLDLRVGLPRETPRPAGLADAARHGGWAFRFGPPVEEDAPPGFREILRGERLLEAALVQLGGGADRPPLHRGRLRLVDDA